MSDQRPSGSSQIDPETIRKAHERLNAVKQGQQRAKQRFETRMKGRTWGFGVGIGLLLLGFVLYGGTPSTVYLIFALVAGGVALVAVNMMGDGA